MIVNVPDKTSGFITRNSVSSKTVLGQSSEYHLSFRFAAPGQELPPPQYVLLGEKLTNQSMHASKLKRHLYTKHRIYARKQFYIKKTWLIK
jgi:hypothetical protein